MDKDIKNCKECGTDISHRKPHSKFCGRICNIEFSKKEARKYHYCIICNKGLGSVHGSTKLCSPVCAKSDKSAIKIKFKTTTCSHCKKWQECERFDMKKKKRITEKPYILIKWICQSCLDKPHKPKVKKPEIKKVGKIPVLPYIPYSKYWDG